MMANPKSSSLNTRRRSNTNEIWNVNAFFIYALNLLIGIGGVIVEIFLIHILADNYGRVWLWTYIPGTIMIIFLLGIVDRHTR